MPARPVISYVTSSEFKIEENSILREKGTLDDATRIADAVEFQIRQLPISELLEIDIDVMVRAEVTKAYSQIRVPCIVEHAGLVFADVASEQYPGGLTKPMWNALGDRFVLETQSAGRRVVARAVVAYCDGMDVRTFVGETTGALAPAPRGSRQFYWDSVFIPDDPSGVSGGRTYAEIVDDPSLGLEYKVLNLSQSARAMRQFVAYIKGAPLVSLWS